MGLSEVWECRQHGKDCKSYVTSIVEEWNQKKIHPNNIPEDQKQFEKCMRWIE